MVAAAPEGKIEKAGDKRPQKEHPGAGESRGADLASRREAGGAVAFDAVPIVAYVSCGYDKGAIRHPYGH